MSASRRRAAYGAPEAPVIPRKTFISPAPGALAPAAALGALRVFEEGGELVVLIVCEVREGRHGRTGVHAARALEVAYLELLPPALCALGGEVGRTEVRATCAEIGVAAHAACEREDLGSLLAVG